MKRSGMMAFLVALGCAAASALAVPMAEFKLIALDPVNTPGEFRIDVSYDDGDSPAGAGLTFLQLDVSGSSAGLTDNDTDYSRFTFTSALPAGWNTFPGDVFGVGDSIVSYEVLPPDSATAALLEGTHTIGFLSVNLLGLAPGTPASVSLTNGLSIGTDAGQENVPGFEPGPNDPPNFFRISELDGSVTANFVDIRTPNGGPIDAAVPEPATFALGTIGMIGMALRRRRLA